MPVYTTLTRNGKPVTMPHGWGWWHIECLYQAMKDEVGEEALDYPRTYMGFPNTEPFTFTQEHTFTDESDGEVLTILPGDVYDAHR